MLLFISFSSITAAPLHWEYLVLSLGKNYFSSIPSDATYIIPNLGFKSLAYRDDGFHRTNEATTTESQMDILGKNGWELVNIIGMIGGDQQYVFKRPLDVKLYNDTLEESDKIYTTIIERLKNPSPINESTELVEYEAYKATEEKNKITENKDKYIKSKLIEYNKYKIDTYLLRESSQDYVPDFLSIYIDASEKLLFDENKYKQSEADQLAQEAKQYFNKIFSDKFDVYISIEIEFNGNSHVVVDPYK